MSTLKVDTIASDTTPTVTISDGLTVSGVTTSTGDISIADTIVHTGDTNTKIRFPSADTITVETGGTERVRVSTAGSLGINNSDPQYPVHIKQAMSSSPYWIHMEVSGSNTTGGGAGIAFDTSATNSTSNNGIFLATVSGERSASANGSNTLVFKTSKANVAGDGSLTSGPKTQMVITEDGIVGAGTAAPYANGLLHCDGNLVLTSAGNAPKIIFDEFGTGTDPKAQIEMDQESTTAASMRFHTEGSGTLSERLRITSGGDVLIGRTSTNTSHTLCVQSDGNAEAIAICGRSADDIGELAFFENDSSTRLGELQYRQDHANIRCRVGSLRFCPGGADEQVRMTNTGQGQIIIGDQSATGTSTTIDSETAMIQCNRRENGRGGILHGISWGGGGPRITLAKSGSSTVGTNSVCSNGDGLGTIIFAGDDGTDFARSVMLMGLVNAAPGNDDMAGEFRIYTSEDGSHSPTVRYSVNCRGIHQMDCSSGGEEALSVNRTAADGTIIGLEQAGTQEGNIAVSGSTVSYNGGHLSRWSKIAGISETDKSARPTIYQGTVMSNLDELCVWSHPATDAVLYTQQDADNGLIPDDKNVGDVNIPARDAWTEDNQQLNKTKVSTVDGDKDVAGVFWTWDDADDEYVNDYYIAMTGDMVIRVAGSTTVARGDLLISAGDGTAKPQADDIIRSSTIAKIISTNSTATYADGSKAYPCVLMAC